MANPAGELQPLIILTCPRSFSSLVCGMLGQHPGLYALPETNLFVGATLGEMLPLFRMFRPRSLDGLYRCVAELEFGGQTSELIAQAKTWVEERKKWNAHDVLGHLSGHVGERILIDKSPSTAITRHGLGNALKIFPHAFYLHLTRHPVNTTLSIQRLKEGKTAGLYQASADHDPEDLWYSTNESIMKISDRLPSGHFMHVRGEDILTRPEVFLPQICEWLGLPCDAEALDAMRHPERSPYACIGPREAPFGNDPNYLRHPVYQQREIRLPALDTVLEWRADASRLGAQTRELATQFGYV